MQQIQRGLFPFSSLLSLFGLKTDCVCISSLTVSVQRMWGVSAHCTPLPLGFSLADYHPIMRSKGNTFIQLQASAIHFTQHNLGKDGWRKAEEKTKKHHYRLYFLHLSTWFCCSVTLLLDLCGLWGAGERKCFSCVDLNIELGMKAFQRGSFSKLWHTIYHSSHTSPTSLSFPLAPSPPPLLPPLLTMFLISTLQTAPLLQSAT